MKTQVPAGHLDYRGFTALIVFLIGMKIFDGGMSFLVRQSGHGAPIVLTLGALFVGAAVWMGVKMMLLCPGMNWLEALSAVIPRGFVHFFGLFLFAASLLDTGVNLRLQMDSIAVLFLRNTPTVFLFALFCLGILFVAFQGLETISRVCSIMLPYLVGGILLGIALLYPYMHTSFIYPLPGIPVGEILRNTMPDTSIFAEILMIVMLAPYARKPKDLTKGIIRGMLLSYFMLILILLLIIFIFDADGAALVPWPFQQALQTIYINRYIQHLDAFFAFIWVAAEFLRFIITFYVSCLILAIVLKLRDHRPVIPLNIAMVFVIGTWGSSIYQVTEFRTNFMFPFIGFPSCAALLVLSIYGNWRLKKKQKRGAKNEAA